MGHVPQLLLQLVVILAAAHLLAWILRALGQSQVIGEMLAGLALGPIVFGAFAPELHGALFPVGQLGALEGLSQLGLVLFMFIVGAELRAPSGVRERIVAASWIGVPGVLVPMALGFAIAPQLHRELAPAGIGLWPFALFIAVSMAITAFPTLARILKDRDMTRGTLGQLALCAAAMADVFAWILLALVVALIGAHAGGGGLARALGGLVAVALIGFGILRPLLARFLARHATDGRPGGHVLSVLLIGTFAMAAATEWLGLHPVFGAFLFGACLPRDNRVLDTLVERIEHVALLVLMPVFFALAGLNTSADALSATGLGALALILVTAVVGKVIGSSAGARIAGLGWRDSLAIGSLMNARGLMELIVLKIGLDAGVIGNELFTMLMIMAILTTLMTTPMLDLFLSRKRARAVAA